MEKDDEEDEARRGRKGGRGEWRSRWKKGWDDSKRSSRLKYEWNQTQARYIFEYIKFMQLR